MESFKTDMRICHLEVFQALPSTALHLLVLQERLSSELVTGHAAENN